MALSSFARFRRYFRKSLARGRFPSPLGFKEQEGGRLTRPPPPQLCYQPVPSRLPEKLKTDVLPARISLIPIQYNFNLGLHISGLERSKPNSIGRGTSFMDKSFFTGVLRNGHLLY